jgi:hypothetical protein
VEERNGAEHEEIETDERVSDECGGGGVRGSIREAEREDEILDQQVDGDEESGDDTAGAEEDPQERFDAKFGWLSVHLVFCPFVRWNPSGCVDSLVETQPTSEKQIPHPAKSAGIRDDSGVEA